MLLSVAKWRRILRGTTETKSAPKTIFSGNGNGLKNCYFLKYTRTKECPHSVYVKQDCTDIRYLVETEDKRKNKTKSFHRGILKTGGLHKEFCAQSL